MDIKLLDRKGGYINAIDAHTVVREQADGGQDTLMFETAWRPIEKGSRVVVQLPTLDWQEYVVTGLSETAEAVEVSCEHAIYDMFGEFIEDLRPTGTADYLLDTALQCSRWKRLGSSASGSYSTNFYRTSVREAVSKIQELSGLVLRYRVDVAGAAVTNRWCWWEQPGVNNRGFRFESGINAERIERRIDDSQILTSLYGFGRGQYDAETGGYGRRVDFSSINGGIAYVEDAAAVASYGRRIFGKIEFDDTEDAAEVLARTQAELAIRTVPQVRYSGTVYDLGFDDSVSVGETVMLQTSDVMKVRVLGRVLRLVSHLDRTRANRIEIGNYTDIFAPVKTQRTLAAIREQLATDPTRGGLGAVNSKIVSELLENFNAQINEGVLTGTVTALPGGFIFESADGATHIGPDGWRVANTKNPDGSWAFTTLATGNGLAAGLVGAEQIIAGSITTDHVSAGGISAESIYIGESVLTSKIETIDAETAQAKLDAQDAANAYADKLLNDEILRADAYADNVLTLAEQKAIEESGDALSKAQSNLLAANENLEAFVRQHVSDEMSELKTYVRTDPVNGNLLIGAPGSQSVLRQSNEQMTFEYNGEPVAYFGAGETDMPKAGVDTELRIGDKAAGNYYWVSDADGGMSLVWK